MTLRQRLAALDQRVLPGHLSPITSRSLRRAALLYGIALLLTAACTAAMAALTSPPATAVAAGVVVGLCGGVLVARLLRPGR